VRFQCWSFFLPKCSPLLAAVSPLLRPCHKARDYDFRSKSIYVGLMVRRILQAMNEVCRESGAASEFHKPRKIGQFTSPLPLHFR
jgi:hypothetical protein